MNTTDYQWRKSRRSDASRECVEAGNGKGIVAVRDSTQEGLASRDMLAFTSAAWREFTRKIKTR